MYDMLQVSYKVIIYGKIHTDFPLYVHYCGKLDDIKCRASDVFFFSVNDDLVYMTTLLCKYKHTYNSVVSIFFAVPSIVLQYAAANFVMICSNSCGCKRNMKDLKKHQHI